MQVWMIASARATIGGPSRESRTPCSAAAFHRSTTLSGAPAAAPAAGSGAAGASIARVRASRPS
jgi:hypothetical protein